MQQAPQPAAGGAAAPAADNYKWMVLITVVFGAFASILDNTIVNTALPTIQHDFNADLHVASYVATGYTLAAGVVVPATAYLAARFGIKQIYVLSLATFTIFSALCGAAPNIDLLIFFRVLQGAGGAALFPLSFSLLFAIFPENERGRANGIFGIPVLAAPALGPTIGGYLSEYVGWRWNFYVNVPIGIIGVILAIRSLRSSPANPNARFDPIGFLLAAGGLGLILYGLSNLAYDGWNSTRTVSGPIIAAAVLLLAWIPWELRHPAPLLNLRLYARRNYLVGTIIVLLSTISLFGPGFLLPQYLQTLRGQTPFQAGLLLLWQGVGAVIGTVTSGQLYNRIGVRALILIGTAVLTVTGFWLGFWTTATSALVVLPFILLPRGLGLPLTLQSTNTTMLQGIAGPNLPQATTLNVVARNVVASLAIAILTNYLQQRITAHVSALGGRFAHFSSNTTAIANPALLARAPAPVKDAIALAYHDTFLVSAATILPLFVLAFLLRSATGMEAGPSQRPAAAAAD